MNGHALMTRILLAALGLILATAVASSAGAGEIITRRAVANGAEVVVELVDGGGYQEYWQYSYRTPAGIDWAFYREIACLMRPEPGVHEEVIEEHPADAMQNGHMEFNDRRVCLFLPDADGCIIVTLDLPPAAPRVHVDSFLHVHGFLGRHATLLSADELVLSDDHAPLLKPLRLKHDPEGTWRLEGVPYETHAWSGVFTVPLPSLQEVQLSHSMLWPRAERNQRYRDGIRLLRTPAATAAMMKPWGLVVPSSAAPGIPLLMATHVRLESIRDCFAGLKPWPTAPEIEPDLEMPSMLPIWRGEPFQNGLRPSLSSALAIRLFRYSWMHHGWLAGMEPPCSTTAYHRTVCELTRRYERWKSDGDALLLESMRSPDDLEFLQIITREMLKSER